jgi:ATP-dependent Clp protease, protease subunit
VRVPSAQQHAPIDFAEPVLLQRQVLQFGPVDQQAAEVVIKKLLFLDAQTHAPIDLYLQTPGGELKNAMAVQQIMERLQSPVNTYALSECNSAGALLLAAGTGKRRAFRSSVIILHGIQVFGKAPPEFVEMVQDAYTRFWRERSRLPDSWLPLPLVSEHVLSAEEALNYGIVDEVVGK